jgi:hypothetical protein
MGASRTSPACIHDTSVTDLERSHAELRAALILAGKRIRKLNFGRSDDPVLQTLRRVLRGARIVAKGGGYAHAVVVRRVIPLQGRR